MKSDIGKSFSEHYRKRRQISKEKNKRMRENIYKESVNTICVICHDIMYEDENIFTKCFQCFDKRKNFDKRVQLNNCNHVFHESCIKEWYYIKNNCPICRNEINEIDEPHCNFNDLSFSRRLT